MSRTPRSSEKVEIKHGENHRRGTHMIGMLPPFKSFYVLRKLYIRSGIYGRAQNLGKSLHVFPKIKLIDTP